MPRRVSLPARMLTGLAALPIVATVLIVAPGTAPAADAATVLTSAEQQASAQAAATDEPVVVDAATTETEQVTANPDGTFTLEASQRPVRAQVDDQWQPIDPHLVADPQGGFSPAVSLGNVRFSGGGSGPAVTLTGSDGQSVAWTYPFSLPTPMVNGASATYRNVLPGVDLVQTATEDSYAQVLVVHDAAAAANPALRTLRATVRANGVQLAPNTDGGLTATDDNGDVAFVGGEPSMWDATPGYDGTRPTATSPGDAHRDTVDLTSATVDGTDGTAQGTISLTPDPANLTGPQVTYPVFIDPSIGPTDNYWRVVQSNGYEYDSTQSNDDLLRVGKCTVSCSFTARSYLSFNIAVLGPRGGRNADIGTTNLKAYQMGNQATCSTAKTSRLYTAGTIRGSVWPGSAGSLLDTASSNGCKTSPKWVTFDAAAVGSRIQTLATAGTDEASFGLLSGSESDSSIYLYFNNNGTNNPTLTVNYVFPPNKPDQLGILSAKACGSTNYVNTLTPTLQARVTDNNPSPLSMTASFFAYKASGGSSVASGTDTSVPSGAKASWVVPAGKLMNGTDYKFGGYATNSGGAQSYWADPAYYFTVQTTGPSATPTYKSLDYPENTDTSGTVNGVPIGTGGITVSNPDPNIIGIAYAYDDSTKIPATPSCTATGSTTATVGTAKATNGSVTLTPPASLGAGPHILYAKAYNTATNESSMSTYKFTAAATSFSGSSTTGSTQTIQAETQNPTTTGVPLVTGTQNGYYTETNSRWAGGAEQHIPASGTNQSVTYKFTVQNRGKYDLQLRTPSCNHFGTYQFDIDLGTSNALPLKDDDGNYYLLDASQGTCGTDLVFEHPALFDLEPGEHSLTLTTTGTSASTTTYVDSKTGVMDNGYALGIDYIRLTQVDG